ncbi:MAG: hypothetical protein L0Y76_13090 [Ignavibacteria bacterium]|nr:hypothetical protein [Ignavibacteria bacterium]
MKNITAKIRLPLSEDDTILREGIVSILKPYCDIKIIPGSGTSEYIFPEIHKLKTNVIVTAPGIPKFNLFSETAPKTNKYIL